MVSKTKKKRDSITTIAPGIWMIRFSKRPPGSPITFTPIGEEYNILDDDRRTIQYVEVDDKHFEKELFTKLHAINKEWIPTKASLITSYKGGTHQVRHTDYDPDECGNLLLKKPASVIYALGHGTKLWIWNDDKKQKELLSIPKDTAVVFTGDVRHAGFGYTRKNRRLHYYLDTPTIKWDGSKTYDCPE